MMEQNKFERVAIRHLFAIVNGGTPSSQNEEFWNGDVLWVTPEDLSQRASPYIDETKRTISEEGYAGCGTSLVPPGSIVLSTRAPIGNLGIAAHSLCTNQGCKSLIPNQGVHSKFFFYQLEIQTSSLNRLGRGSTFLELSTSELASFKLHVPTFLEQQRIANFLDEQTARIDALIAAKEELLGKLVEYRVAIAEAVVADITGKPRVKLGLHVDLLPGYAFASDDFSDDPNDVPLLRGINVAPGCIRWDDAVYWPHADDATLERFRLRAGDVVFGMDRPWVNAGTRVAMIDKDSEGAFLLQRVCRLRGGSKFHQRFIYYALASDGFRQSVEVDLTGVSVPHISPEQILSFKVPAISFEEQADRCEKADTKVSAIDELAVHASQVIDRLRECRSSLISAAVTGQIDINNFQLNAA